MRQFALSGPYVSTWPNGQNTLGIRPTGVSAFVGPTFAGPVGELSPALRSFAEFQALYGGLEHLPVTADTPRTQRLHLLGHAAHAFFAQGGQRLHVVRVETPLGLESDPAAVLAAHAHGLRQLDDEPDVSLVAMPAAMALHGHDAVLRQQLMQLLLDHVSDPMRCRMAILDAPAEADVEDVLAWRQSLDCPQAALYHPWLVVPDPTAPSETLNLPPSGFLCGIYARSDALRGVHRAPANEVLHGVLRLSCPLSHQEQIQLTAQGVNSLRTLSGLGTLVWGARTLSCDPQWQYVSVRRQFDHLKACLTQGLQWVVFEANEEPLWTQVRDRIDGFLMEEWQLGALAGQRPEQAYYVRCDRSTMTEADQRAGRLVCQIGVAQTRPSEFRVLRLELTTAPGRGSVDL